MEKTKNTLFDRDFSKPVYTILDANKHVTCNQCKGEGRFKVIVSKRIQLAPCAMCEGVGKVPGIAKEVSEMFIKQIDETFIVQGNRRETVFHLYFEHKHNKGTIKKKNSDDGFEVFETKKQAELVLKAWLEDDK